ncbi:MAG: hypothetical protein KH135_01115 [Firmicutes bacterium]|nr:hypothetical protein [Bacillota bacterium]
MNSKEAMNQDFMRVRDVTKHPEQYDNHKIYHTLTENGTAVLNQSPSSFQTCFSILGSFDQGLNMISKGCTKLVLCDKNPLTYYHSKLCIGAISALSLNEYIDFRLVGTHPFQQKYLEKMNSYLEPDIRYFWKFLFQIHGAEELFQMIYENAYQYYQKDLKPIICSYNSYLEPENYDFLKKQLLEKQVSFDYYFCDFLNLPENVWKENYDEVYLSNILISPTKMDLPKYIHYLNQNIKPVIKPNGEIVSAYLANHQYYFLSKEEKKLLENNQYYEKEIICHTTLGSPYKEHIYTYQKRK